MYKHPVHIKNYRGKFNNVDPYEHKSSIFDITKDIKNKDSIVLTSTLVNGFWIGDYVMEYFGLWMNSGRQFVEDDFILKADAPISVILGADYAERTQWAMNFLSVSSFWNGLFRWWVFWRMESTFITAKANPKL